MYARETPSSSTAPEGTLTGGRRRRKVLGGVCLTSWPGEPLREPAVPSQMVAKMRFYAPDPGAWTLARSTREERAIGVLPSGTAAQAASLQISRNALLQQLHFLPFAVTLSPTRPVASLSGPDAPPPPGRAPGWRGWRVSRPPAPGASTLAAPCPAPRPCGGSAGPIRARLAYRLPTASSHSPLLPHSRLRNSSSSSSSRDAYPRSTSSSAAPSDAAIRASLLRLRWEWQRRAWCER